MSRSIIIRLLSFFGLGLATLWLPWWLLLLGALILIWSQPYFYEILLLAWGYDSLYGPSGTLVAPHWPLLATLLLALLIWFAELAKKNLVIYRGAF